MSLRRSAAWINDKGAGVKVDTMGLCRICGTHGPDLVSIFHAEGLRNKIETCLPIVVSPHSLLPDTICPECTETVDHFYDFLKKCLENIIILETQYEITQSCLKSKRKSDKGCTANFRPHNTTQTTPTQTDSLLDTLLALDHAYNPIKLVDYDASDDEQPIAPYHPPPKPEVVKKIDAYLDDLLSDKKPFRVKQYFDDSECDLITEISERKSLKRKASDDLQREHTKMMRLAGRRKGRAPKRFLANEQEDDDSVAPPIYTTTNPFDFFAPPNNVELNERFGPTNFDDLPQVCLLCEARLVGPAALANHVFDAHGIDMAQIVAAQGAECDVLATPTPPAPPSDERKKKKMSSLVRFSDLKRTEEEQSEDPPTLSPSFVCVFCPAVFTARPDLFVHLRLRHPQGSAFLCGICLHQATSYQNLKTHLEACQTNRKPSTRFLCKICWYGEDNFRSLENHVMVHEFLLENCRKQSKIFDPADYIESNSLYCNDLNGGGAANKGLNCSECGQSEFDSFKEFSTHRRSQHSIFHCDLCNKFYGRNSHLWKHVNRLHKGHPSITCQLCYKTSASKYHLAQHFNKIHSTKGGANGSKQPAHSKNLDLQLDNSEDFMSQKFQAFDFQSVKQSFMKQELMEQERRNSLFELDDNSNKYGSEEQEGAEPLAAPKEIDSTSDLYTNIITNYTPPTNEGEFKCPKCSKGFHKKTLLKKHRKNCRPRLQKDLLTRCKSCARIFKDRQSLAKHLVNYHSEYACEICKQIVQSKCEIVSHIRFTHPNCELYCQLCGNILRSRSDLLDHIRNHVDSYVCQFCGDSLPSKIKLKMHILSLHRKILSLSCGVCLKLFETQPILRDHVRLVHKDQLTPLTSCPVCGKNYGSKWKTYDHLNKSHGRIFRACKTCLEVFDNENQLQEHCESAHANQQGGVTGAAPNFSGKLPDKQFDSESEQGEDDEEDEEEYLNVKTGGSDNEAPPTMSKISLLEKRLLGEEASTNHVILKQEPKGAEYIKREALEDSLHAHSPNHVHNNSSTTKRTVYVNSNDPSYCEICLKTWPAKKHLWQHYIRCHKSVAATVCGICLKTNPDYRTLQEHLVENHPTLLHGQGFGSNFICRICGRYHNASSKLKLHMAIHENFDWSILSEVVVKHETKPEIKQETNGFPMEAEGPINYESLIEQVECSSQSEDESDDQENQKEDEEEDSSSSDDDDDGESDAESSSSSMETQMFKNIMDEKKKMVEQTSNQTYSLSEEEGVEEEEEDEEDDSSGDDSSDASSDDSSNNPEPPETADHYRCKPEELDSAIKSISYESDGQLEGQVDEESFDSQPSGHGVNDLEIEEAVGSIL